MCTRAATYDASIEALRRIMREQEVRTSSRGGTRGKQRTIKLSRAEDCRLTWEEYLRCKHYMQDVVQRKIAEPNHRQLKMITRVGRDSGRRFRSYVRGLDHKPPQHDLRDEATGMAVTDLPQHLTRDIYKQLVRPRETLRRKYSFLTCAEDKAAQSRPAVRNLVRQVECECAEKDYDDIVLRTQGRNLRGVTIR
ncbi:hypothetical protein HPB50_017735 [Hyalomma asiaticum]|uniref:Uncharacterized protein n=1 Tax=Hyalomma asiaticum TaxID=266040 RepID=A0ACB7SXN6_HYAAI|nr:hypothetical protein HPB50_017735 [Hyalomma asiaticum]